MGVLHPHVPSSSHREQDDPSLHDHEEEDDIEEVDVATMEVKYKKIDRRWLIMHGGRS